MVEDLDGNKFLDWIGGVGDRTWALQPQDLPF